MTIYDIRVIAASRGVDPRKLNKTELIRAIQVKEGNTPCFKTGQSSCDQPDCCWKNDCLD